MSAPDSIPDFRDVIANLDQLSRDWQEKSAALGAAMAAAGNTIERAEFTLTVAGGRITALTFTPRATSASPVQLREALMSGYSEVCVRSNNDQANAVASILGDAAMAAGMRGTVPEDFRERTADLQLDEAEADRNDQQSSAGRQPPVEDFLADPSLDDEIVSADIIETMSDVEGWHPGLLGRTEPGMAQYELEKEVQAISARAGDLRTAMTEIRETAESKHMSLTVNAAGQLLDVMFRSGFRSAGHQQLSSEFTELVNTAIAAASNRALGVADSSGLVGEDDPSVAMFRSLEESTHEELSPDDPRDRR